MSSSAAPRAVQGPRRRLSSVRSSHSSGKDNPNQSIVAEIVSSAAGSEEEHLQSISGVSHISFSVRDAEASATRWATPLGLTEIDRVGDDTWRGIVMLHPPTRTVLEVQQHHGNTGEVFDPRRTGT